MLKISLASVLVTDQDQALRFYTEVLGFSRQADVSMGGFRWLTVGSPAGIAGVELLLSLAAFPPARTYQKACLDAGMPATAFFAADIQAEFRALTQRGVVFRGEPKAFGPIHSVLFEDSCGNLINLVQPAAKG